VRRSGRQATAARPRAHDILDTGRRSWFRHWPHLLRGGGAASTRSRRRSPARRSWGAAVTAAGCSAAPRSGSMSPVVQQSRDVGLVPRVAGSRVVRRTTARSHAARATGRETGSLAHGNAVP